MWSSLNKLKSFIQGNADNLECECEEDDNLVIENARKVEGLLKSILIGGTEGKRIKLGSDFDRVSHIVFPTDRWEPLLTLIPLLLPLLLLLLLLIMVKLWNKSNFYFLAINMPRDRFPPRGSQEERGRLDCPFRHCFIQAYASFNWGDVAVIAEALKSSEFVEVSADGLSVRRAALPENPVDCKENLRSRQGFTAEGTTLSIGRNSCWCCHWWSWRTASIRLRRNKQTKAFKGSVFWPLKSEEEMQTFSWSQDPRILGVTLEIMDMTSFMERTKRQTFGSWH